MCDDGGEPLARVVFIGVGVGDHYILFCNACCDADGSEIDGLASLFFDFSEECIVVSEADPLAIVGKLVSVCPAS